MNAFYCEVLCIYVCAPVYVCVSRVCTESIKNTSVSHTQQFLY